MSGVEIDLHEDKCFGRFWDGDEPECKKCKDENECKQYSVKGGVVPEEASKASESQSGTETEIETEESKMAKNKNEKGKTTKKTDAEKSEASKGTTQQSDALKKAQEARAKKSAERREVNKKLVTSISKKLIAAGFTEVDKTMQLVYHRSDKDRIWLFKNGSMAYMVRDDVFSADQVDGKAILILDEAEAKKRHLGRIRCIVKNLALLDEICDDYPVEMEVVEKEKKKPAAKKEEAPKESEGEEEGEEEDDLDDDDDDDEDDVDDDDDDDDGDDDDDDEEEDLD